MGFLTALTQLGVTDILDIAVVAVVIYGLVRGIRRSRSGFVLTGLIMVSSLYVVARFLGLSLVTFVFQAFFTVFLVALIVIFQEDLRRLFERVALRGLRRRTGANPLSAAHEMVETLVRTLVDLARDKVGVILVIQGRDSVLRHVHGGVPLDAKLSEGLLKSLFDPHSIGHDGAVIVAGERVVQFSCHLPLSADADQLRGRGTRHAAALGLAERTDALCLIASEERGSISKAKDGELTAIKDRAELRRSVEEFLSSTLPPREKSSWIDVFRRNTLEKLVALVLAALLWFFLVHESEVVYRSFVPTIDHAGLPADLIVERVLPRSVQVILSGPRRSFYFVEDKDVGLTIKLFNRGSGEEQVPLTAPDASFPPGLTFENIIPRDVLVKIVPAPPPVTPASEIRAPK